MFTDVDVRGVPRGRCNREKCECDGFTRSSAEASVGGSGAAQWGWCCYCGHPPVCHARIERKVFDDGDTTLDSEHHAQSPPPDPPTHHEHIEVAQPRTDDHVLDPTEETPGSTGPENNSQENSISPAGKGQPVHTSGLKRVHSDEDTSDSDTSTSEKRVLLQKVASLEDDMRNLKRRLVDEQPVSKELVLCLHADSVPVFQGRLRELRTAELDVNVKY
ncbi:hypothetical protein HPB50_002152 [Hyalomma asiaticum]|uniref:Uncharacterized protein n=1 Tax=Hyalomma asiaticum TaxID=266040 RepID=A0ACB7RM11_HYAAI|nr:hypothetical protein HPB50_002152 [Hyalomma asiaticum]